MNHPLMHSSFKLSTRQTRFIFLFSVVILYTALFLFLEGLRKPIWWDEKQFWQTTLYFSESIIPSFNQLKNYSELTTPLAFIIYGWLENLFHGGIFSGRLFNFILSFGITCFIGIPTKHKGNRGILALIGLILFCPYYLWLSGHLYTDIMASAFVLYGTWAYISKRFISSGLGYLLGIATRQFMLAFPVATAAFEFQTAIANKTRPSLKVIFPLLAALSIIIWFFVFQGLANDSAFNSRVFPEVQSSLWALTPNSGLYFLSILGFYFVIPEWIIFNRQKFQKEKILTKKNYLIAISLGLLFIIFPPFMWASGTLIKISAVFFFYPLKILFFYVLALLTSIRFSKISLSTWILIFYALIMMKAHPWDRYALPLLVVFWYLKSLPEAEEQRWI